jgi:hypothetical protein
MLRHLAALSVFCSLATASLLALNPQGNPANAPKAEFTGNDGGFLPYIQSESRVGQLSLGYFESINKISPSILNLIIHLKSMHLWIPRTKIRMRWSISGQLSGSVMSKRRSPVSRHDRAGFTNQRDEGATNANDQNTPKEKLRAQNPDRTNLLQHDVQM